MPDTGVSIPLELLSEEAFAPFGRIIKFSGHPEDPRFEVVIREEVEPWRIAMFRVRQRTAERLECHPIQLLPTLPPAAAVRSSGLKTTQARYWTSSPCPAAPITAPPHALKTLELKQGEEVTVYVSSGTGWTNGDDFSFAYDFSQVAYNLLSGLTLEQGIASVRLPWAGDYIFTADITGGTVTVNKNYATMGSTVVITAAPAEGYVLDSLKAVDTSGNELPLKKLADGGYAFTIPGRKVTVTAVFAAEGSETGEGFTDVPSDAWFAEAVKYVTEQGLMNGTAENTFSPMLSMSRSMLVTVLYRLEGEPEADECAFTDVADGTWYTDAVAWAAANGIVTGINDTTFAPDAEITRESLAVILYRYAQMKELSQGETGNLTAFADGASVSDWAAEAMSWAVGEGILTGKSGNTLAPQGTATRAEVSTMLMRFHKGMQA